MDIMRCPRRLGYTSELTASVKLRVLRALISIDSLHFLASEYIPRPVHKKMSPDPVAASRPVELKIRNQSVIFERTPNFRLIQRNQGR